MSKDFLENLENNEIENEVLQDLTRKVNTLKVLRGKEDVDIEHDIIKYLHHNFSNQLSIATLEKVLKSYKEIERKLSQEVIPLTLLGCGLSEIKLKTGQKITIQDKLKASISTVNKGEAYINMIKAEIKKGLSKEEAEQNINGLFKSKIEIDIDEEVMEFCINKNIPYETSREIHWQTLNKYCKTELENGYKVPEGITYYQYRETKIKE